MSTLLAPVDFSQTADALTQYAAAMAKHLAADLVLLNVYPLPISSPEMPAEIMLAEEIRVDAEQRINALVESLGQTGLNVSHKLVPGSPGSEIVYYTDHHQTDLILMASHSATGTRKTWLGSNTLYVLDRTRTPLLVVPENHAFEPWQRVVCGTDFHHHELHAIAGAAGLLKAFNAELILMHINDGGTDEEKNTEAYRASFVEKVRELTGLHNIEYNFVSQRLDILDELHQYSLNHDASALLMLHKVRKGLACIFEQSLTKSLVKNLAVPLLSYPILPAEHAFGE